MTCQNIFAHVSTLMMQEPNYNRVKEYKCSTCHRTFPHASTLITYDITENEVNTINSFHVRTHCHKNHPPAFNIAGIELELAYYNFRTIKNIYTI